MGSVSDKETSSDIRVLDILGCQINTGAIVQRDATVLEQQKYITQKDIDGRVVISFVYMGNRVFYTIVGIKENASSTRGKMTMNYENWKEDMKYEVVCRFNPERSKKLLIAAVECHRKWLINQPILMGDRDYDIDAFNSRHIFDLMAQ